MLGYSAGPVHWNTVADPPRALFRPRRDGDGTAETSIHVRALESLLECFLQQGEVPHCFASFATLWHTLHASTVQTAAVMLLLRFVNFCRDFITTHQHINFCPHRQGSIDTTSLYSWLAGSGLHRAESPGTWITFARPDSSSWHGTPHQTTSDRVKGRTSCQ